MSSEAPREVRFRKKVPPLGPLDCWEWLGWRNPLGYGVLMTGPTGHQRKEYAHRLSWEFNVGPIPDGLLVLHRCDNPPCVNPAHLWLGTHADNNADMAVKGRARSGTVKLTPADVLAIRERVAAGERYRSVGLAFGIGKGHVHKIAHRLIWRNV